MEDKIINKLRLSKKRLNTLYKKIKREIDIEAEMIDSESLQKLSIVSKIDEELTDIIYIILNNKNS